ncbi:hypothetical protein H4219_002982 [Mycoemilia scoparia]|uniref:Uncharacterized protein n=1 Tax=Mycoemilia scoparia TaxID=417184 RepID=A0A9W7ZZZ2_9FUNG|nr:hypothetical protein H4219_002965 [Mycoemilia scoparia]KAJ1917872.1 hypothetical protein H4219_002982 [Mycoemilia scoparia]
MTVGPSFGFNDWFVNNRMTMGSYIKYTNFEDTKNGGFVPRIKGSDDQEYAYVPIRLDQGNHTISLDPSKLSNDRSKWSISKPEAKKEEEAEKPKPDGFCCTGCRDKALAEEAEKQRKESEEAAKRAACQSSFRMHLNIRHSTCYSHGFCGCHHCC